jgi:hypothetical protein
MDFFMLILVQQVFASGPEDHYRFGHRAIVIGGATPGGGIVGIKGGSGFLDEGHAVIS